MHSTKLVVAVVSGSALASVAHAGIIPQTFSGSMTHEASISTPGSTLVNETWSSTSTSPLNVTRSFSVPTTLVEPWARAEGTMTTTYGPESLRVDTTFAAETSTSTVSTETATARSVAQVTLTFTITQAGSYTIRGGSNVTAEGFGTFSYSTSVNMTGPANQALPAVDGPFNPNMAFVRTLPVGLYTLNLLATVAGDSGPGAIAALSGSAKFEIVAVPTPGVFGLGLAGGFFAVRRRRHA